MEGAAEGEEGALEKVSSDGKVALVVKDFRALEECRDVVRVVL